MLVRALSVEGRYMVVVHYVTKQGDKESFVVSLHHFGPEHPPAVIDKMFAAPKLSLGTPMGTIPGSTQNINH